jgi:hypothetical protein
MADSAWGWKIGDKLIVTQPTKKFHHILWNAEVHYHIYKLSTVFYPVPR